MFPGQKTITFREVQRPADDRCGSGHLASLTFQGKPTRFFLVSGAEGIGGPVCEPCVILAQAIARRERSRREQPPQP